MSYCNSLEKLYTSHLNKLIQFQDELEKENSSLMNSYAGPILMYIWDDNYLSSNRKILFIGQETNGWWCDRIKNEQSIISDIDTYKNFKMGEHYKMSPFWKAVKKINAAINPGRELNFAYTNINKFGKSTGVGKPAQKILDKENKYFNVLADELKILNPDAVIFFTGPYYDYDIQKKIGCTIFEPIKNHSPREFAHLRNHYLPTKSYRTYHPEYLYKSGNTSYLDELINLIK